MNVSQRFQSRQVHSMAVSCISVFALLCAFWIQSLEGMEPRCSAINSSGLRMTFDSNQNSTGHWTHALGIINRGLPKQLYSKQKKVNWKVDIDYNPEFCSEENKDSLSVLISFSVPVLKRNPDYKFYPGLGYYKFQPSLDVWTVAKEACEKEDAHLAIINSQGEADLMKQLLANSSNPWSWVGLIKNDAKGEFTTVFGDPISSTGFSTWYSGVNPANAGAISPAVIHKTAATLSYGANTSKYPSVCELGW